MFLALVLAILATGGVLLLLVLVILANRVWREAATRWRRRRRAALEPLVLAYAHGAGESIQTVLAGKTGPRDQSVLEEIILDHAHRVRGVEHARLGRAFDELGLLDRCLRRLSAAHWHRRAEAAEKLGLVGAQRATKRLAAALDDNDPEVRLRAAKALGALGGPVAIQLLIEALDEPTRWSTIRVGDILARTGPEASAKLREAFPNLSPAAQLTALDILGQLRALEAEGWLEARLADPAADVRARACHALGVLGDAGAGPALLRALADEAWPVRAMAAKALGRIAFKNAVPQLTDALRDQQWWVRLNSAEALRQLGEPGLAALLKMLDDRDPFARHQAVLMLQEAGVLDREVAQLSHSEGPERAEAETFVRSLVRAEQTGRLRELVIAHPDIEVRKALARMLPPERPVAEARQ